jgi:hypothetical protein
MAVSL